MAVLFRLILRYLVYTFVTKNCFRGILVFSPFGLNTVRYTNLNIKLSHAVMMKTNWEGGVRTLLEKYMVRQK